MFRLLLLLALGFLIYLGLVFFQNTPKSRQPEEIFRGLTENRRASAQELARICNENPKNSAQRLSRMLLRVDGTVQRVFIAGVSGRRAGVILDQSGPRRLVVLFDLDRYSVMQLAPSSNVNWKFVQVGNELWLSDPPKNRRALITRDSSEFSSEVMFDRVAPNEIILNAVLPSNFNWSGN